MDRFTNDARDIISQCLLGGGILKMRTKVSACESSGHIISKPRCNWGSGNLRRPHPEKSWLTPCSLSHHHYISYASMVWVNKPLLPIGHTSLWSKHLPLTSLQCLCAYGRGLLRSTTALSLSGVLRRILKISPFSIDYSSSFHLRAWR